jgi:hypothetical protein
MILIDLPIFIQTLFQDFSLVVAIVVGLCGSKFIAAFIVKLIYILFWSWVLNLICKDGHTGISWLLVLFPFILLFVMMGLLIINM